MHRAVVAVCVAALAGLLAGEPAHAAGWAAPTVMPLPSAEAKDFDMAVNPDGVATAVWAREDGTILSATRTGGGPWSTPVAIAENERSAGYPRVKVNLRGDALATWTRKDSTWTIRSAERPAGGSWLPAVSVGDGGYNGPLIDSAINAGGAALIAWRYSDSDTADFVHVAQRPARGAWEAPVDLGHADGRGPRASLADSGLAAVIWYRARVAARPAGGVWTSPADLGSNLSIDFDIGANTAGRVTAVWSNELPDGRRVIQSSSFRSGDGWQPPVAVSDPGSSRFSPSLAVDPLGNMVAVWESSDGEEPNSVRAAVSDGGGAWSAPVTLASGSTGEVHPDVEIGPGNTAFTVFHIVAADGSRAVQAAIHDDRGWQPTVTISGSEYASGPGVAVLSSGEALAYWYRSDDTTGGAAYDLTAPKLGATSIPATAVAGVPVAFSAAPTDLWSAPTAAWSIAGAPLTGNAVTFTFPNPGVFSVGVSASDGASNAAAASQNVTVADLSAGKLKLSPAKFKAAKSGASARTAAVKTGTTVTYALNGKANVRFTVDRPSTGRKSGTRCVKQKKANRRHKRCTLYIAMKGSFSRARDAGADRFKFTGRVGNRTLKPGAYRLLATPTGGGRRGPASTAKFTVRR